MSEAKQPIVEKPAAPAIGLSKQDLIEVIQAVRQPVKTEEQVRLEQEKTAHSENMREQYARKRENQAAEQNWCQHKHKIGVGSPVTYVADLNRLYCQHCALWIFPTAALAAQNGSLVEPTKHPELFNRLFEAALKAEAV